MQVILVAMAMIMAFFHMPKLDEPVVAVRSVSRLSALLCTMVHHWLHPVAAQFPVGTLARDVTGAALCFA